MVRRRSSPNKYNADSVERLVALTDEHADFSRVFGAMFALLICHQVRPHQTVIAVLGKLEQHGM